MPSHTTSQPDASTSHDQAFEDIAAACIEHCEQGGSEALDRFCGHHPEHADRLREVVNKLASTGLIDAEDPRGKDSFPERLGEFRLLERIGMGGMGVVFRAEQESLGRQVALKLIRPDYLYFPGARDRLRREVEAVARLDHPGIVSVLTVGEECDTPYFAMEFVHGCSVAQVVQECEGKDPRSLSGEDMHAIVRRLAGDTNDPPESLGLPNLYQGSWVRTCTRITRLVAEALNHAHHRGIIHRDVKPSNIMLTPNGRVLVVDFGLALLQAAPKLTRSGSTLGSLAYMAPELIRGGNADERVDVYSLGVSLYEMLTLKPAYDGANAVDLQQKILKASFPPPRVLNSSVSRDLETVVLAAMSRERGGRYPSPAALAEDLANVLELRAVRARRPGPILCTIRWIQRHRAGSLAIALSLLFAVGTPLTLWLQQKDANTKIQAALTEARQNFDKSLEAVDKMLTRVSRSKLEHVPQMTKVRAQLMRDALAFYEEFLASRPKDAVLLRRTAMASFELGKLFLVQGKAGAALKAFERCVEWWNAVEKPTLLDRESYGHAMIHVVAANNELGRPEVALEAARNVETFAEAVMQQPMTPATKRRFRVLEAAAVRGQSQALQALQRVEESSRVVERAIQMFQGLVDERPKERGLAWELGRTQLGAAEHYERAQQPKKAARLLSEAARNLETALEQAPYQKEIRGLLTHTLNGVSRLATNSSQPKKAEQAARRAVQLADLLVDEFPRFVQFQCQRATAHYNLGIARINLRSPAEARTCFATARAAAAAALKLDPKSKRIKDQLWDSTRADCIAAYRLQDHGALRDLARMLTQVRQDGFSWHQGAEFTALAMSLVPKGEAGRRQLLQKLAVETLDYLERAVDGGVRGDRFFTTPGLSRLGGQQRFRELRKRGTAPKKGK